jgi:hypothetical protein
MRLGELVEDPTIVPRRKPDTRPHVGDHRIWTGVGGVIEKQAKRLKHINDELEEVDFDVVGDKVDPEPLKQFGDELARLNKKTGWLYNAGT